MFVFAKEPLITAEIWLTLIGAGVTVYLEWSRRRAELAILRVKQELEVSNADKLKRLHELKTEVEGVKQATNGMKAELVEEVRKASYAQGVKHEADKHPGVGR